MHRDWPWLRWQRRTLVGFDLIGLVVVIAFVVGYFVLNLGTAAHTLFGAVGILVLLIFIYVSHGAHLSANLGSGSDD